MKGRKPKRDAIRRVGGPAQEVEVIPVTEAMAIKPDFVKESETLSNRWDELVGDGAAYTKQDTPLLQQWVFWVEIANQLQARMMGPDGKAIDTMAINMEDGSLADSPYFKQLKIATDQALKLADNFGGTPTARARMGLVKAAQTSLETDLRLKVIKAMEARERKGKDVQN